MAKSSYDIAVVGGGIVGAAIAYGVARRGHRVLLLDEGDVAFRAAVGNFGLVWVQSKGVGQPEYATWTRRSASSSRVLAAELRDLTGIDVALEQKGGLHICWTQEELEERRACMARTQLESGGNFPYEMLDRSTLVSIFPGLGPDVCGASLCPLDGHCNPLDLLRSLHLALTCRGAESRWGARVDSITRDGSGFALSTTSGQARAASVVLAAGLGNVRLAPMVGLHAPVKPERGQVLVTERLAPLIPLPTGLLRQTREGTVMIGASNEDVGFDDGTTTEVMQRIAARAVQTVPALARARIVRAWGSLRVMTSDGLPLYEASTSHPGAYLVTSHSGVTLAAVHSNELSEAICNQTLPKDVASFRAARFENAA